MMAQMPKTHSLPATDANNSYRMKLFVAGCILIAYLVHVLFANEKGCSLAVDGEPDKKSPILLHADDTSSLIVPTNGNVNLNARQTIILLCPDTKTSLLNFQGNVTYARCLHRNVLRVENQDVRFAELECKKIIRGSVAKSQRHCGANKGLNYKIGYHITNKYFVALIEVCVEQRTGAVLYTQHLLHGASIKHASKSSYRPSFSPEGLAAGVAAAVAYKQSFQRATFAKLLRSSELAAKYIDGSGSYLARGHLSPDADFLIASWQHSTYFYLNTAPQWQAINSGNWKRIEGMVRRFADGLHDTLLIITGTHQVLELRGVEIYLQAGRKLPVPKFIYKIVYYKKMRQAIVLVSLNNPFVASEEVDFVCEDVCEEAGWKAASWSDYERGFVHCCDYREFARVVETAPKLLVDGVLQGS